MIIKDRMFLTLLRNGFPCLSNLFHSKLIIDYPQVFQILILTLRPKKKIVVFQVPCQKKTGSVGRLYFFLYPRHLCRRVYSFRLSVRPFVCSFVRLFVRNSVTRQSFASKFLKWCISQQLLIRKRSYLDHSYPGGLAFTP